MAHDVPDTLMPDTLVVGDYWTWRVPIIDDYPTGSSWALSFAFAGPASIKSADGGWTITNEAGGTRLVTVTTARTGTYTPGRYQWAAYVTLSGERYQVAAGWVIVQPNRAAQIGDNRTHAQKMLDLIDAALEGRMTSQEESYQINGRAISKMPIMELRKLRGLYAAEVYREQHQTTPIQSIGVQFVSPS